jgi:hypothetical protein
MNYTAQFLTPDLSSYAGQTVTIRPKSLRWSAIGGPDMAELTVKATDRRDLWRMLEMLGRGIEVSDGKQPIWWGDVTRVQVVDRTMQAEVSLSEVYNRVAVAYSYVATGSQEVGERKTTAWVEDAESVAIYGKREVLLSVSGASDAAAEAARDEWLASHAYPEVRVTYRSTSKDTQAVLYCEGWWQRCDAVYYANSGTDSLDTAIQVGEILDGQDWVSDVVIEALSGVSRSEYRAGDASALVEIDDMLAGGTTNGRRMLARVERGRRVIISEEPARTATGQYRIGTDGRLMTAMGTVLEDVSQALGKWIGYDGLGMDVVSQSRVISPVVFSESIVRDFESDAVTVEPRRTSTVGELLTMKEG